MNANNIKFMKQTLALSTLFLTFIFPYTASNADGLFSAQDNTLFAPFLNYQEQNYLTEFSMSGSNQLQLNSAIPRADQPAYGAGIQVDEGLNFTMQRISFDGQLYNADITFQQNETFSIENISLVDESMPARGNIVESTLVNQVSQSQFNSLLSFYNIQQGTDIDISAMNDVQIYSVTYETLDPSGSLVQASALVAFPTDTQNTYPLIAYQHGTEVLRADAPSQNINDLPTLGLAASGYVVVSADFLGLGESALLHPYIHAHSLATTVIDALRSAKLLAAEKAINLNNQLFLIGYSEGGYATMATHREIQRNYSDEFTVTASAPMAGPYDLSGTMLEQLFNDAPLPSPFYFPYTLLAYNQIYGFTETLSDYFQSPYDQNITSLYDGNHSDSEIDSAIPEKRQLYTQHFFDLLDGESNSGLKVALTENDSFRWVPNSPMYLFHCINDEKVPYQNTQVAFDYFQSTNATQVQLFAIDEPALNQGEQVHSDCAIPLLLKGKDLFDAMVQANELSAI